jgi:hypothetical protein
MSATMTISIECRCGSNKGVLPERPSAASIVRCECGREHGTLAEIRDAMRQDMRQATTARAREIFRVARGQLKPADSAGSGTMAGR